MASLPNSVRFDLTDKYNAAWAQPARWTLAASFESTMKPSDAQSGDLELRAFIDGMPALAWSYSADGFPEFVNRRLQDFASSGESVGEFNGAIG